MVQYGTKIANNEYYKPVRYLGIGADYGYGMDSKQLQ